MGQTSATDLITILTRIADQAELVLKLQAQYFSTRSSHDLKTAKSAEGKLRDLLSQRHSTAIAEQGSLL
jgi:hypothetical protein